MTLLSIVSKHSDCGFAWSSFLLSFTRIFIGAPTLATQVPFSSFQMFLASTHSPVRLPSTFSFANVIELTIFLRINLRSSSSSCGLIKNYWHLVQKAWNNNLSRAGHLPKTFCLHHFISTGEGKTKEGRKEKKGYVTRREREERNLPTKSL